MQKDYFPDHYETLQVSVNADFGTIERVYRHLAKRLHPDNPTTGDAEKFRLLVDAYDVLSHHEKRAAYDAKFFADRETISRAEYHEAYGYEADLDQIIRKEILELLYRNRRNNPQKPGVGFYMIARKTSCPEDHLLFHIWYLKEKGLIQMGEDGTLAITVEGVDDFETERAPVRSERLLMERTD